MTALVVIRAFGSYGVGTRISDAATVAALLGGSNAIYVVRTADDGAGSGGPVTPAQPGLGTIVAGVPDPSLGALYGYAIDLTSTPATVYQWTGTAWVVAIQAGSGTPLTAPGPIAAAPTASTVTTSAITLAWLAPTTGGAPTDYLVQYKLSSASTWTTVDEASPALGATVAGLTAATSYDFRVQATNGAGQGTASPVLTVSTAAAPVAGGGALDFSDPNNSALAGG